jgi:hypothetical protein
MSVPRRLLVVVALVPLLVALQNVAVFPPEPPGMLPVGSIVAWWGRPEQVPFGYEICDGKPSTDHDAIFRERKPDLRGRFLRGSDTPQSFNPRSYDTGGSDMVTVEIEDVLLQANQLPGHVHPMPHVHLLGDHEHDVDQDLTLATGDKSSHTHLVSQHQHQVPDHVHPLDATWTELTLATGSDVNVTLLEQAGKVLTGSAQLPGNGSQPFDETGNIAGAPPQSGKAQGTLATSTLGTTEGFDPATQKPDLTGPVDGPAITGLNGSAQQPIGLEAGEADNRPAYMSVLWIIRIK